MKGYIGNIEELTLGNQHFRKVLYTAKNSQLVVMSIKPGEDIGEEVQLITNILMAVLQKSKTALPGRFLMLFPIN